MRRPTRILIQAFALSALACGLSAHPLGNFTVNRYARLEPGPTAIEITYIVDLAEIPTFQALARDPELGRISDVESLARAAGARRLERDLAKDWLAGLRVTAGSRKIPLTLRSSVLAFAPGAGGMPTLKLRLAIAGRWSIGDGVEIDYRDGNSPERLGWREVVIRIPDGTAIMDAGREFQDRSAELSRYPTDPARGFPQETTAHFRWIHRSRTGAISAAAISSGTPGQDIDAARAGDRFSALVQGGRNGELTPSIVLFALLIAAGLGAGHALSPGHGKTVVGAYLVGSRGTALHAVVLGAVVTFTHTAGVFLLGGVTLFASQYILPERLYPWLGFISGAMVAVIGATLFHERIERALGITGVHRHLFWKHAHGPGGHSHDPADAAPGGAAVTLRSLVGLGVSGGMVPCPAAIVVLLAAVGLHRVGFGLLLIVAFSVGLASVLIAIGILFVHAARFVAGTGKSEILFKVVPVVSALAVALLGLAIAIQSLVAGGVVRITL